MDPVLEAGVTGQFDVLADGELIASRQSNWLTRRFGAGYPSFDRVVADLEARRQART